MTLSRAALWIVCVFLLASVGCSRESNNKGKIEGTKWHSEKCTIDGKEHEAGDFYLEFKKDGKMVFGIGAEDADGTYTLGAGDQVTFNFDKEVGGRKSHVELITINGDKLTMADSKGKMPFSRGRGDEKLEGTAWYNEPKESTGKYRNFEAAAIDFHLDKDGAITSYNQKIGTYKQDGETLTIEFTEKFRDTEWKSKAMPVKDYKEFLLTDAAGDAVKMKKR